MKNKKVIIFITVVVLLFGLSHLLGFDEIFSVQAIVKMMKGIVEKNLGLALLIYIGFTIVGCVLLALPGITFAIVAGMLFGPVLGTIACSVGTTIGAMIAFIAGRFFLKDSIKPKIENNKLLKKWLFDESGKNELFILMITRLVPIFPYNLQNFAYGVTDIHFLTYSVGSILFMLPGTAMYTVGVAGIAGGGIGDILIAVVIGIIAISIAAILRKRYVVEDELVEKNADSKKESCVENVSEAVESTKECVHCHLCQKECEFLTKYEMDVADIQKRQDLLYHCYLCGNCTAVCPKEIDGRKLILDLRGRQVKENGNKIKEAGYNMLLGEKQNYIFRNYKKGKKKSVLFPGCNFPSFYPKTTDYLVKLLAEYDIGVVYDCCGKPVGELGLLDRADEICKEIDRRLENDGVEELIVLCPNCYYYLRGRLKVSVVTIYEKLKKLDLPSETLCKIEGGRTFLPCPDREKQILFDDIKEYLGNEPEKIEGVQCCGLGGCAAGKEAELSKELAKRIGDDKEETFVYCASCASILARNGVQGVKHYLSEILGVSEMPDIRRSLMNRAKKRF